jgi:uncharacterized protein YndB with AHSA1/START domain
MTAPQPLVVHVRRHLEVSPERVFDAWLDPDRLSRWMFGPAVRDEAIVRLSLDARPGGAFSFIVRRNGVEIDHVGTYLEIDRPRRLVFTWAIRGDSDDAPSRVAIDVTADEGGCLVSLTHEMDPKWADYADRTRAGWTTMLEALARALESNAPSA